MSVIKNLRTMRFEMMLPLQTVVEGVSGQGEDQQAVSVALQRLAEKDPEYYGPKNTEGNVSKSSATGLIREILFIDQDSCFWQIHEFLALRSSTGDNRIMQALGNESERNYI